MDSMEGSRKLRYQPLPLTSSQHGLYGRFQKFEVSAFTLTSSQHGLYGRFQKAEVCLELGLEKHTLYAQPETANEFIKLG